MDYGAEAAWRGSRTMRNKLESCQMKVGQKLVGLWLPWMCSQRWKTVEERHDETTLHSSFQEVEKMEES